MAMRAFRLGLRIVLVVALFLAVVWAAWHGLF
jgi:hypothetical protein